MIIEYVSESLAKRTNRRLRLLVARTQSIVHMERQTTSVTKYRDTAFRVTWIRVRVAVRSTLHRCPTAIKYASQTNSHSQDNNAAKRQT
jgi:hypothetical protein